MHRAQLAAVLTGTLVCLPPAPLASQNAPPPLDQTAMEEFLRTARIVRTRSAGKGVTASIRATMQQGELTHDAHIQTVDQTQREFRGPRGIEFNFRDKWQFNVAAYKLDQMLGLQLVPATVERRWNTEPASFTWWVDDVMMDEGERVKKQMVAPNQDCWVQQRQMIRFFDLLIENTDRNPGNLIITKAWRLWAIDHTRAFRRSKTLEKPESLNQIERGVLERLSTLEFATLKRELTRYIEEGDIRALLARRDAIVAHFNGGRNITLFDRRDAVAGCLATAAKGTAFLPQLVPTGRLQN